jgi:hypothetical protein
MPRASRYRLQRARQDFHDFQDAIYEAGVDVTGSPRGVTTTSAIQPRLAVVQSVQLILKQSVQLILNLETPTMLND